MSAQRLPEPIKDHFSIQDLENLSGIKAHTIRMWEKRYDLLQPARDANNIRSYCSGDLRKLLNVAALIHYGYRISAIACLPDEERCRLVNREAAEHQPLPKALSEFKLAMMTFDQAGFDRVYGDLLKRYSFREVFSEIFLPLLGDIGLMWQTGTIHIGHEHFISNLIKQKILLEIEKAGQAPRKSTDRRYVLYLPANEVHEIGLLYTHYALLASGAFSVYLGPSVPPEVLQTMTGHYEQIDFVVWMTVEPPENEVGSYVRLISETVLRPGQDRLWLLGRRATGLDPEERPAGVRVISRPDDLLPANE